MNVLPKVVYICTAWKYVRDGSR